MGMKLTGCATGRKSGTGWGRALPNNSGLHQTICLWRRESLIPTVALGKLKHGERLTVHHFWHRENLP